MKYPFSASMPYRLHQIANLISAVISEHLDAHGLSLPTYRTLVMLRDGHTRTLTQLANIVAIEQSTLSRQVSKLVQSGLVTRIRPEENGRIVRLTITEPGRALIESLIPSIQEIEDSLLEGLEPTSVNSLVQSLDKIEQNLLLSKAA